MKLRTILFSALSFVTLSLVSCSNDDDNVSGPSYNVPTEYVFERNGESSVDFTGQTQRIKMLVEFDAYSKNQAGYPTFDSEKVSNMFSNTNNPFSEEDLNVSGKQLRNKTAASADYFATNSVEANEIKMTFDALFTEMGEVAAQYETTGTPGVMGSVDAGKRLVNGKGLEINQAIIKGLMGACFMDQALNNYLSLTVLDETKSANDAGTLEEGKNYTTMEHKWDEAYGYVFGYTTINTDGSTKRYFWESYMNTVNGNPYFEGISDNIKNAFIKGRAAIINKDYTTRNEQIKIIKENLSVIGAVRAVYYLNEGKELLSEDNVVTIKAFHALSEGYGFIAGLRFTNNPNTNAPYFNGTEVNGMLESLLAGENGFWDASYTASAIDDIMLEISQKFGFTIEEAITEGGSH
ncbi:DUF4856 domain-containing protein [Flavobacterium beibuense]|uniref:Lipoprotein n=1 Tax=Flavobacterium beibuense TaxID=657326 RepID=A0A444W3M8_9FLAO|nr:DUF4856 domain-containing protein [Flavobacterium beibuense]RYJ40403.1 lipoprotein [Flavobacterium beibuense]